MKGVLPSGSVEDSLKQKTIIEIKLTQNVYKFKGFGRDTGGTLDS